MGRLMRAHWIPICMSEEVAEPDGTFAGKPVYLGGYGIGGSTPISEGRAATGILGDGPSVRAFAAAPAQAQTPQLHWPLDNVSGATTPDTSGNGFDGTLTRPDGTTYEIGVVGGDRTLDRALEATAGPLDAEVTVRALPSVRAAQAVLVPTS